MRDLRIFKISSEISLHSRMPGISKVIFPYNDYIWELKAVLPVISITSEEVLREYGENYASMNFNEF